MVGEAWRPTLPRSLQRWAFTPVAGGLTFRGSVSSSVKMGRYQLQDHCGGQGHEARPLFARRQARRQCFRN